MPKTFSLPDLLKLVGHTTLITGAAGGLGSELVKGYAAYGQKVVAVGRNLDKLKSLGQDNVIPTQLDLNDEESVKSFCKSCPSFDNIILSHGLHGARPMRMINHKFSSEIIQTNLLATLDLLSGLLRAKKINSPGRIIFISSISAHMGGINNVVYVASKAGMEAALRGLARDLLAKEVTVNSIAPAGIETPLFQGRRPEALQEKNYPLGLGQPADVVNASLFLSLEGSRYITGEAIILDGGNTWLE